MAAKKKKKAARPSKKAKKAKKTTRKAAKKAAKKSKKTVKTARKSAPRKAAKKAAPKKAAKKPAKKKQIVGEGDYQASRSFLKDQAGFVKKNKDKIPELGKDAEAALEGSGGEALREAEATAAARSRDLF
jgi:hypothetical protein